MKVLVACEFSGIVRDAFIRRGHDAVSCDLLPTESPGPHIQGDVLEHLDDGWDMMIAHPPCTHLAVSGARHFHRKQKEQTEALDFVRELLNAKIHKIALENPISIISSRIRMPDQIIQPYFFGDNVPKKTCLWLKNLSPLLHFEKDCLFPSQRVEPKYVIYNSKKNRSRRSKYSVFGRLGKGHGHERSVFSKGIANAMAEQWGQFR